ncbi:hypothetical protein GCM10027082_17780 [Comamonas humi]
MGKTVTNVLVSASLSLSAAAWAARDFTPQAGTWVVDAELNGQPGRGLGIEVRGNALYLQVFNYRADGSAAFHAAAGELAGHAVTTTLQQYRDGRWLGGPAQSGRADGTAGEVTLRFTDGVTGSIQFPGEPEVAIRRFAVGAAAEDPANPDRIGRQMSLYAVDEHRTPVYGWNAHLQRDDGGAYRLSLRGKDKSTPNAWLRCVKAPASEQWDCEAEEGTEPPIRRVQIQRFAADVRGQVEWRNGTLQPLFGHQTMVAGGLVITGCMFIAQIDVADGYACLNGRRMPANGVWMVADEIDGAPGRGLNVDVQDGIAMLQMFDYGRDGRSSFHAMAAPYEAGSVARGPLLRYQQGRYFGSGPLVASLAEDAGELRLAMEHESTPGSRRPGRATEGTITLPGEPAKRITKLTLGIEASLPEQLLGSWHMLFRSSDPAASRERDFSRVFSLQTIDHDGVVYSAGRDVACRADGQNGLNVRCDALDAAGQVIGHSSFFYDGVSRNVNQVKYKDRFGNWMGI